MVKKTGSAWGGCRNLFRMSNTFIRIGKIVWADISVDYFYEFWLKSLHEESEQEFNEKRPKLGPNVLFFKNKL